MSETSSLRNLIRGLLFSQEPLPQFLRFLAVGVVNTLFGLAVFSVLVVLGLGPVFALGLGWIISMAFNFQTIGRLVFREFKLNLLFRFLLVYAVAFLSNAVLLELLISADVAPIRAQALLVLPVAILTFALNRLFVFNRASPATIS